MIELPRALAAWAPQLELFPPELALALGRSVAQLAQLVGGFSSGRAPEGEPDGYDGITQRGPFERLLPTQWLLLDVLPEEFLRRVVAGEHAYLRRGHAGRAAQRRCVALFDAGVEQLGAPRIGQLALLLVLAQRAEQCGASFEWGVLQDPGRELRSALTPSAVRSLLAARCAGRATAGQVAAWLDAEHGPRTSELWLVGAASLSGAASAGSGGSTTAEARRTAVVSFSDVLEPGAPQRLAVRAQLPWRGRSGELTLELPDDRLTARLLRDPFAPTAGNRVVPAGHLDPLTQLVFSPDGRRLYARTGEGALLTVTVQGSLNAPVVRPSAFPLPPGQDLFAVSRFEKRTVVLARDGDVVVAHMLSKRGTSATGSYRFEPVERTSLNLSLDHNLLRPLGVLSSDHFAYVDDAGDVVELVGGKLKRVVAARALASAATGNRLVWASLVDGVPRVSWAGGAGPYLAALEIGEPATSNRAIEAAAASFDAVHLFHFGRPIAELVAFSGRPGGTPAGQPGRWMIVGESAEQVEVPAESFVVGVVAGARRGGGLLVMDPTKRRLEVRSAGEHTSVVTTGAPIVAVTVSATGHELAYRTSAGELGVYSTARQGLVLSLVEGTAR